MEWQDEAIVLSTRKMGERDVLLEVLSAEHGRHLGIVRGGRSPRNMPVLQPGNLLEVVWRARLEENLGHFTVEPLQNRTGILLSNSIALACVNFLVMLLRLLPERSLHRDLFGGAEEICASFADSYMLSLLFARFELLFLSELGFGLDLSCCAATGTQDELTFVSPKSGRAVSKEAGEPWAARLFPLPQFFIKDIFFTKDCAASEAKNSTNLISNPSANYTNLVSVPYVNYTNLPAISDIKDAFKITGFFLDKHIFLPRGVDCTLQRENFLRLVLV